MEGECDPSVQIQHNATYETINKTMVATLVNHNEMFLNDITNFIKEAFSLDIQNRSPTYSLLEIDKYLLDRHYESKCPENLQLEVNTLLEVTLFSSKCNNR